MCEDAVMFLFFIVVELTEDQIHDVLGLSCGVACIVDLMLPPKLPLPGPSGATA